MGSPARKLRCVFVHVAAARYADPLFAGPRFPPLWAYTLAAHVADDGRFDLRLHDTRLLPRAAIPEGDVYLFTGLNQDLDELERVRAGLARRFPGARAVVGGPICASLDREGGLHQLSAFDHVCVGDGEELIRDLLDRIERGLPVARVHRAMRRFPSARALPLYRPFLAASSRQYFGALVEVSRGCPFLCEFCDVRVAPGGNRPESRPPDVVIQDMDYLSRLGVHQFQLVCDNFIGDLQWAEEMLDRIIAWQEETGFHPSVYSWATINLSRFPRLMEKMRHAGFQLLNIGIESFNRSSLLETAKAQNVPRPGDPACSDRSSTRNSLVEAIREIQSRGLIVAAGMIFGFDSDGEDCFRLNLEGLLEAGVLSGEPSLLTALPGTPLYRRMKLAGRLRPTRCGLGYRYQTNIKYLLPRRAMVDGVLGFLARFTDGAYQYARLTRFFDTLDRGHYVPTQGATYLDVSKFARMTASQPRVLLRYGRSLLAFFARPRNLFYVLRGFALAAARPRIEGRFTAFWFWLFVWVDAAGKSRGMSDRDFDVGEVGATVGPEDILPSGYTESGDGPIPASKVAAQQRYTTRALTRLVAGLPPARDGSPTAPSTHVAGPIRRRDHDRDGPVSGREIRPPAGEGRP